MTSTRAMEGGARRNSGTRDKLDRGRNVALAFTMQGWGQLVNQGLLILCLLAFHGGGSPPYGEVSTQWTFRISFAFIDIITLWLIYHRVYKLQYADWQLRLSKRKSSVTGYDKRSLQLVTTHYWHRLVATAGCWFCNDFMFYGTLKAFITNSGNKSSSLFSSKSSVPIRQSWEVGSGIQSMW